MGAVASGARPTRRTGGFRRSRRGAGRSSTARTTETTRRTGSARTPRTAQEPQKRQRPHRPQRPHRRQGSRRRQGPRRRGRPRGGQAGGAGRRAKRTSTPTLGEDFGGAGRAREADWALDDQLIEPGLVALSMPVREAGRIACVVSVVSHTSRHTAADLRDTLLPRLGRPSPRWNGNCARHNTPNPPRPRPHHHPLPVSPSGPHSKQELGQEFIESLARGLAGDHHLQQSRRTEPRRGRPGRPDSPRATARRALMTWNTSDTSRRRGRSASPPACWASACLPFRGPRSPRSPPHLTELSQRLHDFGLAGGPDRRRDPVHGPRLHQPRHERPHHRRHPPARVPHRAGPGDAGGPARARSPNCSR